MQVKYQHQQPEPYEVVHVVDDSNTQNPWVVKKIKGHIEEEELWKLQRCLVGEMTTVCSISSISQRLSDWGMGEIKVQRLGGKSFLLTITDDELFMMLEDLW
ncbi:hypothetical protein V6N13_064941 [Hibiscus sabdariffa]